jgi:2',3'-cyclic-nucleotide 2'-phosphodiesterase (5'-nucleotidase family)
LDAGDLLCSKKVDPSLSSLQQKEAVLSAKLIVDAFSLMGCDAVGIGEDDLRLGAKAFAKVKKVAEFPFLSSNAVAQRGRRVSVPSVIREAGGLRWGIFSLMSAHPTVKDQNRDWKVLDPVSTGIHVVKELQGKADIIILLAAMPLEELRALLPQVGGITIAVAGDNPSGLRKALQVGQTVVVSSYAYGRYLGVLTLSLGDLTAPLIDEARITQLERELAGEAGKTKGGASAEVKQKMEADLEELKRGNSYRNELIMLSSRFQEDPAVQKLIADFSEQQKKLNTGCSVR